MCIEFRKQRGCATIVIHQSSTHILYTVLVKSSQGYQAAHRFCSGLAVEAWVVEAWVAGTVEALEAVALPESQP